jgi:subtilisin family serine protease
MQKVFFAVVALATAAMVGSMAVGIEAGSDGRPTRYVVVYSPDATTAMRAAVRKAGGRVVKANSRVGVATAISSDARFKARLGASGTVQGVARDRVIGRAIPNQGKARARFSEEYLPEVRKATKGLKLRQQRRSGSFRSQNGGNRAEPLADLQWDMQMIRATTSGSYRKQKGSKRVLVGIIDTGVDGSHPDIAPNFNRGLSRNFTTDIPVDSGGHEIDGPCEEEPDGSCNDPNDVDENGHGTHVASTVGSPINGLGMAGVAPNVSIVNLRAGQDSGFFFLQPSVDAFTWAADRGVDVVNMSYFIDPWLYNCRNLAADSPEQQAEQRTIIEAAQRGLDYAHLHGVTLVGAAGNSHTDLGLPNGVLDEQSPNFPLETEHDRLVNNGCLDLPTEGNNVISVSSVGPSKTKADYSNYGYDEIDVAAPGGWFRDEGWPDPARSIPNQILAAYPESVARESGDLNPDGTPNTPFVVRDCKGSTCAYYQWIQGTSMASPHAAGVAALIVAEYGKKQGNGTTLHPQFTRAYLQASAMDTPCMTPNPFSYADKGRVDPDPSTGRPPWTTFCEGTPVFNGVYGHGIVDALGAVTFDDTSGDDDDDDD